VEHWAWAVLASLSASQTNELLAASVAEPAALTNGYQWSFAIGAGLVLVALVVAGTVLRPAKEAEGEAMQERDRPLGDAAWSSPTVASITSKTSMVRAVSMLTWKLRRPSKARSQLAIRRGTAGAPPGTRDPCRPVATPR
jgi:hypothetical protein